MNEDRSSADTTLALSTKVEEDFISPLTSIRGSLEILRDFPNLALAERQRFVETALRGCARLEEGVSDLAKSVYAASERAKQPESETATQEPGADYTSRIEVLEDRGVIEVDFSDFVFNSTERVNAFYDAIDRTVQASGRSWYFVINYHNCSIWPEAWVAFAHRGKRLKVGISLGTVRYEEQDPCDATRSELPGASSQDSDLFSSREAALARIEEMKQSR